MYMVLLSWDCNESLLMVCVTASGSCFHAQTFKSESWTGSSTSVQTLFLQLYSIYNTIQWQALTTVFPFLNAMGSIKAAMPALVDNCSLSEAIQSHCFCKLPANLSKQHQNSLEGLTGQLRLPAQEEPSQFLKSSTGRDCWLCWYCGLNCIYLVSGSRSMDGFWFSHHVNVLPYCLFFPLFIVVSEIRP